MAVIEHCILLKFLINAEVKDNLLINYYYYERKLEVS